MAVKFDEVIFPEDISRGSSGGPSVRTDVVEMRSGFEERNAIWKNPRHEYNVGIGLRNLNDVYRVKEFFMNRSGRLRGFRFKDWSDYKSGDPNKSVTALDAWQFSGNGTKRSFQITKPYYTRVIADEIAVSNNFALAAYVRKITKPRRGKLLVSRVRWNIRIINNVPIFQSLSSISSYNETSDFVCNYNTGVVDLSTALPAPTTPDGSGNYTVDNIYCGFEFDVPVRFNQDKLMINVEVFQAGEVPDISLIEIRI